LIFPHGGDCLSSGLGKIGGHGRAAIRSYHNRRDLKSDLPRFARHLSECSGVRLLAIPVVAAEAVTKRFGDNQVLTDVTLGVAEREVVCVVGPSGSGKTTLLRCIALLEEPSGGRIVMLGRVISQTRPNAEGEAGATRGGVGHRHGFSALQFVAPHVRARQRDRSVAGW